MLSLEAVTICRSLNPDALRVLSERAVIRRFTSGAVLWTAGARPRGLYLILQGRVRVVRASGGRQHVIHTESAGATIGEVPLFAGGSYPASAIAAEDTVCAVVGADTLLAAIGADPSLAMALLARMAGRVRDLVDRLDGRSAQTVRARLAEWLLHRAGEDARPFTLGCSQAELAEELGTVREVLVRELRRLRASGLLRAGPRRSWEVTDPAQLRRLASQDP